MRYQEFEFEITLLLNTENGDLFSLKYSLEKPET